MRKAKPQTHFNPAGELNSAFPFLNVLLCLVGALVLSVLVVSIGRLSIAQELTVNELKSAEYERLRQQAENRNEAIGRLTSLFHQANATRSQLEAYQEKQGEIKKIKQQTNRLEKELAAMQDRVAALQERVETKRRQRDELKAVLEQREKTKADLPKPGSVKIEGTRKMIGGNAPGYMEALLIRQAQDRLTKLGYDPGEIDGQLGPRTQSALRQFQADRGLSVTGTLDEQILKLLGIDGMRAFFAECRGDYVIVHPSAQKVSVSRLKGQNAFQEMLTRVERDKDKGAVLILMIRPDGVKTFDQVHSIVRKREIRYGFLPIPGFGEIDLSAFNHH